MQHRWRIATAFMALAAATGIAQAQGFSSETSLRFWQMHRPESPFREPAWMEWLNGPEPESRYGARNAREAYSLLGSPDDDADLEPARLSRKLLLSLPLAGRGNLMPLLLEPSGSLAGAIAERLILRTGRPGARIEPPPGFVAIDTHVHTCYSPDSVADPAQVLHAAARRGLAGIAVTDHNTVEGAEQTRAIAARLKSQGKLPAGFQVIEGEEIGSREGHLIGLFLHATIPSDLSAEDTIAAIHAQGGIAVAAHPLLPSGVGRRASQLPFDAVEVENMAEELHFALAPSRSRRARSRFYAAIIRPQLGVSDAHDPSAVGLGYTLVPGSVLTEIGLRQALAAGKTQPGSVTSTRGLRRAGGLLGSASTGFGRLSRAFGWGGHLLKGITGADAARLRPTFGRRGLGFSLRLTRRF